MTKRPPCEFCAIAQAKLEQSQADFARLVSALGGQQGNGHPIPPPPPKESKPDPLPKSVLRALVTKFPGRTKERADHELMAREMVAAGVKESEIAGMIEQGRPFEW